MCLNFSLVTQRLHHLLFVYLVTVQSHHLPAVGRCDYSLLSEIFDRLPMLLEYLFLLEFGKGRHDALRTYFSGQVGLHQFVPSFRFQYQLLARLRALFQQATHHDCQLSCTNKGSLEHLLCRFGRHTLKELYLSIARFHIQVSKYTTSYKLSRFFKLTFR